MATLEQIIDEARALSPAEKRKLRQVLDRELEQVKERERIQPAHSDNGDEQMRQRRMEWLKSHREEYGGQYVALDGDQLLAVWPVLEKQTQRPGRGQPGIEPSLRHASCCF